MRESAHPLLADYTTLGMGGRAQVLLQPESIDDCAKVEARLRSLGCEPLALGRGSNMLAADGDLPLALVQPAFPASFKRRGSCVRVSASYPLPRLLARLAHESLTGLEGLCGIPGSLGGAIAMNAGSFGVSIGDCVESVTLWADGNLHTYLRKDLSFSYRHFRHPLSSHTPFFLITEAVLALHAGDRAAIFAAMRACARKKCATQPVRAKSAGCVFQNPPGDAAGRLLEEAGCKGKQLGGVAFSTLHANFLLNTGNGRASDALALMRLAKDAVFRMSGIDLQPEVRIVPCMRR